MNDNSKFYIVDKKVLPEVFVKVVEVKKLVENSKAKTIQDAVNLVGISRSAFYKYRDFVFPLNENTRGTTVTIAFNLDDTPGLLSDVLNVIADYDINILTINQTIPINNIANVTVTLDIGMINTDFELFIKKMKNISGVQTLKIIARE